MTEQPIEQIAEQFPLESQEYFRAKESQLNEKVKEACKKGLNGKEFEQMVAFHYTGCPFAYVKAGTTFSDDNERKYGCNLRFKNDCEFYNFKTYDCERREV